MAKNNHKKEKALRNLENARKYKKKPAGGRYGKGRPKFQQQSSSGGDSEG